MSIWIRFVLFFLIAIMNFVGIKYLGDAMIGFLYIQLLFYAFFYYVIMDLNPKEVRE